MSSINPGRNPVSAKRTSELGEVRKTKRARSWKSRLKAFRFHPEKSLHRRIAATIPGIIALVVTAFTEFNPVNPGTTAFLFWTPAEVAIWALPFVVGVIWVTNFDLKLARQGLKEIRKAEEQRRAISAIGVAASWDLDLHRLYQRISQDLRSLLDFDRFTVTSALPTGRMRVEFVSGNPEEGLTEGSELPQAPADPDGLHADYAQEYGSRLTAAIPACNGTLTIRSRKADAYGGRHLELLRQVIAQISPGIANATVFQASKRQLKERTVLAEIGRAVTSEQEPQAIFAAVDRSLSQLINYDHLGVILVDNVADDIASGTVTFGSIDDLAERKLGEHIKFPLDTIKLTEVLHGAGNDPFGFGSSGKPDHRGTRAWIQAPLVVQDRLIGLIALSSDGTSTFGPEEAALTLNVSLQIAPAIQNSVLNVSLKRLADERRTVAAIGLAANNELRLDAIYNSVADELAKVMPYDRLSITQLNPETHYRDIVFVRGIEVDGFRAGDSILILEPDEPGDGDGPGNYRAWKNVTSQIRKLKERGGLESRASAPLGSAQNVFGMLHIGKTEPNAYDAQTTEFLERVAIQITPAIRNAQMLAEERELRATLDRQNTELFEANNARKHFLSTVSHELKTPLTIISGFVDLLASTDTPPPEEERQDTLRIIRKNADQLDVLINDILDISRLDAGTFKLNPAPFCVNELISDLHASFQSVLGLKSQTLNLHAPADETWIKGDRARISQVITNLLSNASKYSPNDTQIELRCETDGDRLQMAVTDQGIGMSEEEQEKLFTAFFRVDNETTRKVSGTGLGLLIAKSITELHDGNINLDSQPGVGTTIKISLPGIVSKEAAEAVEQVGFTGSRLWPKNDTDELDLGAD